MKLALSFDDVLLVPNNGSITTRDKVSLGQVLPNGLSLKTPVFIAPMDTICGVDMMFTALKHGFSPIMHRNEDLSVRVTLPREVLGENNQYPFGVAFSVKELETLVLNKGEVERGFRYICVDTANGHNREVWAKIEKFVSQVTVPVMSGNVATGEGAYGLYSSGVSMIRVGIGAGAGCSTRIVTGFGLPTLHSIIETHEYLVSKGVRDKVTLIADGGIKNSGDAMKALVAGADAVMVGRYLAGSSATPGQTITIGGKKYKEYRGMASAAAKGNSRYVEGAAGYVEYSGGTDLLMESFLDGLRSGLSYAGVLNLTDLRGSVSMVQVTANGTAESKPHGVTIY